LTAGPALGLAARFLNGGGALLGRAALGALPALPPTGTLAVLGLAIGPGIDLRFVGRLVGRFGGRFVERFVGRFGGRFVGRRLI